MILSISSKLYKDYSYTSRYSSFPYFYNKSDDKYFYGLTSYLDDTTYYTLHTVERKETPDSLALKYYGNPTLYWIICSFNHIQNPYVVFSQGQVIKIPSISNIKYDKTGRL